MAAATPILDREAPLPPRSAPGRGLALVLALWLGAVGVAVVCLSFGPSLRPWILGLPAWLEAHGSMIGIVRLCASVLCSYYAMIAVHEMGHALAGLGAGFRFRSLRVGPLVFSLPFRLSFYRGPGAALNGVTDLVPARSDRLARRGAAMVLGGPVANLLTGFAVFLLPIELTVLTGSFAALSMANGAGDLVPFESRLGVSDGKRLWMLWRRREQGERWLALMRLAAEFNEGVLPESLSPGFLAKAIAIRDSSVDTLRAHALAYAAAFYQNRDDDAGRLLETCLEQASHAPPDGREALKSDAAVFQARRRKRADLAEQWLADMPAGTKPAWFRTRVEAAILEARCDVEGALRKVAEVEAAIHATPDTPLRATQLVLLQRWKHDLRPSGLPVRPVK